MDTKHHLNEDDFFTQLTSLFEARKSKNHGSIYLIQKRLNNAPESPVDSAIAFDPLEPLTLPPAPIIIRANNGVGKSKDPKTGKVVKDRKGKVKLSTIVKPEDLPSFFARYADVCKAGMTGLKRREKKKTSKKKGKSKEKDTK